MWDPCTEGVYIPALETDTNLILDINKHTFTTVMTVAVKGDKKVVQSTLCICGLYIPRLSQVGIKQFLKEKKNSRGFQKAKLGYALLPATIYIAFRLYVKSELEMI